ncbi:MAG: hypothetical protein AMXMBFR64_40190 [Myxococcales bacterium]
MAAMPWSDERIHRVQQVVVALLAVGAHATALAGGFLFDDAQAVVAARGARWPVDLAAIFGQPTWGDSAAYAHVGLWRPLVTLSFALTEGVFGLEPLAYRSINLALHVGASLALLALARRLVGARAALVAAVYAVHPATTEAIAIAGNRTEGACAVLFLVGLVHVAQVCEGRRSSVAWAVAAFAGALLSKESGITFLPAAALLVAALRARGEVRAPRLVGWGGGALLAVTALWLVARVIALASPFGGAISPVDNPIAAGGIPNRLLTPMKVVAVASESLVLPLRLSADYTWAVITPATWGDPSAWAGLVVVIAVVAGAIRWWRRPVGLGLGLLAVTWSVASSVVVVSTVIYGDRLLTLPLAGLALAVGALATRRWARWLVVAWTIALGARSVEWGTAFIDERTLFERSLEARPGSARLEANLGRLLLHAGERPGARAHLARALQIHPGGVEARQTLAALVADDGDLEGAVRLLEEAVALRQGRDGRAANNLCAMRLRAGRVEGAEAACRQAVAAEPGLAVAWANLGAALDAQGRRADARAAHDRALELAPGDVAVLDRRGAHLVAAGDLDGLWETMVRRWRARPGPAELADDLVRLTLRLADDAMRKGQGARARSLLVTAWEVLPGRGEIAAQRAGVEVAAGRLDEARRWAMEAVRAGVALPAALDAALRGR